MPKTLLLADDSVTIQKVVGISFASEDVAITTVDNGDDALAKARELHPDVILADVVMPGKSGYEVCEAIKADPALRHIPVLLLTGTFEAFDEERAARAGAAGHVAKPFEAQTLVDRVKELLTARPMPEVVETAAPVAAPVPESPAPVAEASGSSDQAFDFFDENAAAAPEQSPATPMASDALDLDEPDAAFAFGDDDLAPVAQEPIAAPPLSPPDAPPDATIAILPEMPGGSLDATEMAPPPPPSRDEAFDFAFDSTPDPSAAPVGSDDLAQATLLDPAAGADFDVSSSDLSNTPMAASRALDPSTPDAAEPLDEPLEADMPGTPGDESIATAMGAALDEGLGAPIDDPTPERPPFGLGAEAPAPASGLPPDPVMDLLTPEPLSESLGDGPLEADPAEDTFPSMSNAGPLSASEPVAMGEVESSGDDDVVRPWATSDELDTPMAPEPIADAPSWSRSADDEDWPAEPEPMTSPATHVGPNTDLAPEPMSLDPIDPDLGAESSTPAAPPSQQPAASSSGSQPLEPGLRDQLHETLEKIAWDAFGQVTEKIVEQSLERMEQVIWEVVPKLAEALLEEEIRRLKDEEPTS